MTRSGSAPPCKRSDERPLMASLICAATSTRVRPRLFKGKANSRISARLNRSLQQKNGHSEYSR